MIGMGGIFPPLLVTSLEYVMRKIEKLMCEAIGKRTSWGMDNTRVEYQCELNEPMHARMEQAKVYLWGNHIGTYSYDNVTFYVNFETLRKWPTRTTKSRLRALGASV